MTDMNSLTGKIAYVGHGMQRTQDGSSTGRFVRLCSAGAVEAAKRVRLQH